MQTRFPRRGDGTAILAFVYYTVGCILPVSNDQTDFTAITRTSVNLRKSVKITSSGANRGCLRLLWRCGGHRARTPALECDAQKTSQESCCHRDFESPPAPRLHWATGSPGPFHPQRIAPIAPLF